MINYIGDISKRDAVVLKELAVGATNILEFGPGASTQVMAAYTSGKILSVETEPAWIEKTKTNLLKLHLSPVEFCSFAEFRHHPGGPYDLVFNDGVDSLRKEFAMLVWDRVAVGGLMCFHDTRRSGDVLNVAALLAVKSAEIHSIVMNKDHSNITVIRKKKAEHYEDWNIIEGRSST